MKLAILGLLIMTSTATSLAVAQDGSGRGPPKSPIVIGPPPTSLPTTSSPTQQSPPKLVSAATTK